MIKDERLKELMISVGIPDSKSLYQALKQCDMEAELRSSEELETLRAENASIKENLTIAYMDGYAKAQEKIRELEAENAKLIAERESDNAQKEYVSLSALINVDEDHADFDSFFSSRIDSLTRHPTMIVRQLAKRLQKAWAERDLYKNNCVAYECNCLSCKSTFLGEKEQHICFKCLLAEREAVKSDLDMCKLCADSYEDELKKLHAERDKPNRLSYDYQNGYQAGINAESKKQVDGYRALLAERDKLLAEREQWMKQEPVAWKHTERDDVIHSKVKRLVEDAYEKYGASSSVQRSPVNKAERYSIPLYASPLPAQQIPEGHTPHYLTGSYKTRSSNSLVGVIHAVRKCNGDNFNYSLCGKKPQPKSMGWHETRSEITCDKCKAMLSASQPKGDA